MAERTLSERISLALQEQVYNVAAQVNEVVVDVIAAVEDVLEYVEDSVTPAYEVNVSLSDSVDGTRMAQIIKETLEDYKRKNVGVSDYAEPTEEAPVGREQGTPLSREELLRELYKYAAKHSEVFVDWEQDYEDWNATQASGHDIDRLLDSVKAELQALV